VDAARFDQIVRSLAATGSRRVAIRFLGGGSLAALLARLGMEAATATHAGCRHLGERCAKSGQCCSGQCKKKPGRRRGVCACPPGTVADKGACIPRVACNNDRDCNSDGSGKVCSGAGVCKCPAGYGDCADLNRCGPLSSDPNYCGACDVKCASYQICANGTCGCEQGLNDCGDACKECCGTNDCVGGTCTGGTCTCPSTIPVCDGECCATGETCLGTACGACPSDADFCEFSQCGPDCFCATTAGGTTGCFNVTCLPNSPVGSGCSDFVCRGGGFGQFAVPADCCPSGCACTGDPCGGE
jgi:hypothetical protein